MLVPDFRVLLDAVSAQPDLGLYIYGPGDTRKGQWLSYAELRRIARQNAARLRSVQGFGQDRITLLHFDNHRDNIIWFWSTAYAGSVPAMSTPFVNSPEARKAQIEHLHHLLEDPICLTRKDTISKDFEDGSPLRVQAIDELEEVADAVEEYDMPAVRPDNLALLMLTSGSTGNAKAVCLTHSNLLAAARGKASAFRTPPDTCFFNFIGLDHVAGLIEIHLHALEERASQVHVQSSDLISDPLEFIRLANKHRISRTLAPNFFLAKLLSTIESAEVRLVNSNFDLSCLTHLASGGEANVVETADALSRLLSKFGAPRNCIVTAFGMTETCAGAIFHDSCPDYDLSQGYEFASVGKCCPEIEMRIRTSDDVKTNGHANGTTANNHYSINSVGNLEVRGPMVFSRYYNNSTATEESFTSDGWFKTGDQAMIDGAGNLNIVGRTKDTMKINGVNYTSQEIEFAIEDAGISGVAPSFTVCFAYRLPGASTEQACVVYLPSYEEDDVESRIRALDRITKIVILRTGSKPYVLPLNATLLQKSTLGKLSRNKIRQALVDGKYSAYEEKNQAIIKAYREKHFSPPTTEAEKIVSRIFHDVLGLDEGELGVDAPYFEAGLTSIDLIKARRRIEIAFNITEEIPMSTMMTKSTIRMLAQTMESMTSSEVRAYDPVVTLKHSGDKTPLFLFHPGVGEILVFFGLVKFLEDRPVHALRARGFNKGEPFFTSIEEVIEVYYAAIRKKQPHGPYAMAGYSWGSMLAFEVAKKMEADGEEVGFLGAFNLPPHIKWRMRQFDWVECLVHLAYFSDLISEESTTTVAPYMRTLSSKSAQMDYLLEISSPERLEELALSKANLSNWADVAFTLQSRAVDYDPSGKVAAMDVFYCRPLTILGITKQQWLDQHLRAWEEFVGDVQYHEVDGAHYTMLLPEHVGSFQRHLNKVLKKRGV